MDIHEDPEFRWLERGEGEPVVLLHGLMGRMHHWDAVLEALGDGCRPIAPALPVFDRSCAEASIGALGALRACASWTRSTSRGRWSAATPSAGTWPCGWPSSTRSACRG